MSFLCSRAGALLTWIKSNFFNLEFNKDWFFLTLRSMKFVRKILFKKKRKERIQGIRSLRRLGDILGSISQKITKFWIGKREWNEFSEIVFVTIVKKWKSVFFLKNVFFQQILWENSSIINLKKYIEKSISEIESFPWGDLPWEIP